MKLKRLPTRLDGPILIEPAVHGDDRGFFLETFREDEYRDLGVDVSFVQDNHSRSTFGAIRALHFQIMPGQAKLVRAARGVAYDVVVDLRRSSGTFGQWESFELDDVQHRQLFVPVGFAHGFCALSPVLDFVYKVSSFYDPLTERGIAWDDPVIAVKWPVADPVLSARDRSNSLLSSLVAELPHW